MKQLRLLLVIVTALTIQETVLDGIRLKGVHPDVMVLLVIASGFVVGAERGALAGFLIGLIADAFLPTPFGLSALVFTLTGYVVGSLRGTDLKSAWWIPPVTAVAATAAAELALAGTGALLDQPSMGQAHVGIVVMVVSLTNGVLGVPVIRAMAWAYGHAPLARAAAAIPASGFSATSTSGAASAAPATGVLSPSVTGRGFRRTTEVTR